ncbi:MAG TPA: nucleotidyltransferase family protein [Candidatus Limnocylindria bacterium]|nr:nucleotidyltransferase family protein [Candidatus Limnocylindria bacterium]
MTIQEVSEKITPILKANHVEFAGVFGSVARGEDKENSDIDLLIRPGTNSPKGLAYIGLQLQLEGALGRKVDLINEKFLHPFIRPNVEKELITLYGQSSNLQKAYLGSHRQDTKIYQRSQLRRVS